MTDTTVRIGGKGLTPKDIADRIRILEKILNSAFESKEALLAVVPFLNDPDIRGEYLGIINTDFDKVNANRVLKLIKRQITQLKTQLAEMLDVG